MRHLYVTAAIAPLLLFSSANAQEAAASAVEMAKPVADEAAQGAGGQAKFSTGVAKGRDLLDSAISASSLDEDTIEKLSARSLADILRNIPGIRTESSTGDGNSNYTIRGLPLSAGGSKYMQIQEDGLPVLEFGDIFNVASDMFIRADGNLRAVEAIRGGSASTFSSNSPGGVINLISKTGEVEGGSIQISSGVDYDEKRVDFDYGGQITDTLRFHVGGFYRDGEGVRPVGFDGVNGGQIKANITKTLPTGYVRIYAKYLDDRSPLYQQGPVSITGTNDDPVYKNVTNFDLRQDTLVSPYVPTFVALGPDNQPVQDATSEGMHAKAKTIGLEARFDVGEWTITERGRFSKVSGSSFRDFPLAIYTPATLPAALAPTGTYTYASGPKKGQVITDLANLNGNGLIAGNLVNEVLINDLDTFINDLRANRVWEIGGGDLTVTAGLYNSRQNINTDWMYGSVLQDIAGDGESALLNYTSAAGVPQTQDGYRNFSLAANSGLYRRNYDVRYSITAPFGSVNYHIGKLALGASLRYDSGRVRGQIYGVDLGGGRVGVTSYDFNGDGVISVAESSSAILPLTTPAPVNYNYHYVSYSTGANYRVAEDLSVFARYSRGARANADKILFVNSSVSFTDGSLVNGEAAYDTVKQLEGGFKFRRPSYSVNVTGFLAKTEDNNLQNGALGQLERMYRSYGAEVEAAYRRGPFSVIGAMTYTHAEIVSDSLNPTYVGNAPRRQPKFIFSATPQYETEFFTVGGNVIANTSSYAHETNLMKMPGYAIFGAFAQVRPRENLELALTVNNLFNKLAFYEIQQTSVPASGIGWGRAANGRTVAASLRLNF